jgi:5-formyltetrahydrofolate cyclo-ligase
MGMKDENADNPAVPAWRRKQRARLIEARDALSAASRRAASRAIHQRLEAHFSDHPARVLGFYWPFRSEFDPRPFIRIWIADGGMAALPVVAGKSQPLEFRLWRPGAKMIRGIHGIPHPAEGRIVTPGALLVPMLGYDRAGYRLGYGGGYYDRTLAAWPKKPLCIGICFALGRIDSIHPLPHDVPMDLIVTEQMAARRVGKRLRRL